MKWISEEMVNGQREWDTCNCKPGGNSYMLPTLADDVHVVTRLEGASKH